MSTYEWSHFTQRINVNAPKEKLYDAFSTRAGMESWFLRTCEYKHLNGSPLMDDEQIHPRDIYSWMWHGWPDTMVETGEFLQANGKDKLQFVFGEAGTVTVKIYDAENENIVELTQKDIPPDEESKFKFHLGCSTGWVFYLANSKSIIEGGIDLRNKSANLVGVLNS